MLVGCLCPSLEVFYWMKKKTCGSGWKWLSIPESPITGSPQLRRSVTQWNSSTLEGWSPPWWRDGTKKRGWWVLRTEKSLRARDVLSPKRHIVERVLRSLTYRAGPRSKSVEVVFCSERIPGNEQHPNLLLRPSAGHLEAATRWFGSLYVPELAA